MRNIFLNKILINFIFLISSGDVHPPSTGGNKPPGTQVGNIEERRGSQREKVIFEVFHNGQPVKFF